MCPFHLTVCTRDWTKKNKLHRISSLFVAAKIHMVMINQFGGYGLVFNLDVSC